MAFEGYEAFDDPYVYRHTTVLKNKARLRDPALAEQFELEMTTLRAEEPFPGGVFDAAHYRAVHRHLFQDVYGWAGRYRTVEMAKGQSRFCRPDFITREMDHLFAELARYDVLKNRAYADFITAAARFLATLNAIHPFREGNGRAQLSFMHLLAHEAGHPLDFSRVDRVTFLPAMIASFEGDEGALVAELTGLRA